MTRRRDLRLETLENRRLLAGDCLIPNSADMESPAAVPVADVDSFAAGEPLVERPVMSEVEADFIVPDGALLSDPFVNLEFIHGSDFVQQQGDQVFVLDQSSWNNDSSRLLVYTQMETGELELQSETDLSFRAERMLLVGDRAIMMRTVWNEMPPPIIHLGGSEPLENPNQTDFRDVLPDSGGSEGFAAEFGPLPALWLHPNQQTDIEVIHFGESISSSRGTVDGHVVQTDVHGDQLALVAEIEPIYGIQGWPTIWPGPSTKQIHWFDLSGSSVEPIATQSVEGWSLVKLIEGDALVASRERPTIDWIPPGNLDQFLVPEVTVIDDGRNGDGSSADGNGDDDQETPSPEAILTRYSIRDGEVVQVGQLDLGGGAMPSVHVSEDGLTAFTMAVSYSRSQPELTIHLLDLSESSPRIFETIEQTHFRGNLLGANSEYIVLQNDNDNSIYIINADQSTDQVAADRVQAVPLDDELIWVSSLTGATEIDPSSDTLSLKATRIPSVDEPPTIADDEHLSRRSEPFDQLIGLPWEPVLHERVILTLSLSQAQITSEGLVPDQYDPFLLDPWYEIDSDTERFGYLARRAPEVPQDDDSETEEDGVNDDGTAENDSNDDNIGTDGMIRDRDETVEPLTPYEPEPYYGLGSVGMVFGRFNDDGLFVQEGFIPLQQAREINVDTERLLVRTHDSLIQYDWDSPTDPITTELPNREPAISAVDDSYEVWDDGQPYLLDVLANDHHRDHWFIHRPSPLQIVELVDAPDGVEIVNGQFVRVSADLMASSDSITFSYVISNGSETASANVNITIEHVTQEDIDQVVDAVRVQAATDLGLNLDEVTVGAVRQVRDSIERHRETPVVVSDVADDPNATVPSGFLVADDSPQLRVELGFPGGRALYGASMSGSIFQISVRREESTDPIIAMSVRAVDSAGVVIEQVEVGQEFTIEVLAEDLRSGGGGVYSAYFDMLLRGEGIELTGDHETGDGFQSIADGELRAHEVDEFGAVSVFASPPGRAGNLVVYRFQALATSAGPQSVSLNAPDHHTSENTVYGRDTLVHSDRIEFGNLVLTVSDVSESAAADVNGSGDVSALDALMVINFLSEYGSGQLSELASVMRTADAMGEANLSPNAMDDAITSMERLDVNQSGSITALDALVIINRLNRPSTEGEPVTTLAPLSADTISHHDDDDERRGQLF